jgi:hypothetical protein
MPWASFGRPGKPLDAAQGHSHILMARGVAKVEEPMDAQDDHHELYQCRSFQTLDVVMEIVDHGLGARWQCDVPLLYTPIGEKP